MINLENKFKKLICQYSSDEILINQYWLEIKEFYSEDTRHYHNLRHLENMFFQLNLVEKSIGNLDAISFAIFYHDIIYDATKPDNEEQSAILAKKRLMHLGVSEKDISLCEEMILATKGHNVGEEVDVNIMIDIDLSILGASPQEYNTNFNKE